jgi:hypothetical protein
MLYKAGSKSKLGGDKKQSYLKSAVYSFKENSKGKPIKYKELDNGKTKLGRYNK